MNRFALPDGTLFGVPANDSRAAELAINDAAKLRRVWRAHGIARRRMDRELMAATADMLQRRIVETANALIDRAGRREGLA